MGTQLAGEICRALGVHLQKELTMRDVGKADEMLEVKRNRQVGEGMPTPPMTASRLYVQDTTMVKKQWGPVKLITAFHVALGEHGIWGRPVEACDENIRHY